MGIRFFQELYKVSEIDRESMELQSLAGMYPPLFIENTPSNKEAVLKKIEEKNPKRDVFPSHAKRAPVTSPGRPVLKKNNGMVVERIEVPYLNPRQTLEEDIWFK